MSNPVLINLKRLKAFADKHILSNLKRLEAYAEKHNPMFLSISTALPVALMCVVETLAIKFNKKTPDDQKNYLIPQTLSEGALSLGITLVLSAGLGKFASHLLKSGKFKPGSILVKIKDKNDAKKVKVIEQVLPDVLTKPGNMKKLLKEKSLKSVPKEIVDGLGENKEEVFDAVKNFEKGFKTLIGAVTGLFLASNVATPFVTNSFAKRYRSKYSANCKNMSDIKSPASSCVSEGNPPTLQEKAFNSFRVPNFKNKKVFTTSQAYPYATSLKV